MTWKQSKVYHTYRLSTTLCKGLGNRGQGLLSHGVSIEPVMINWSGVWYPLVLMVRTVS